MGLIGRVKAWMVGGPEDDALPDEPPRGGTVGRGVPEALKSAGMGRVVLVSPECYTDTGGIADYLCQGYTVLLNLEEMSTDEARRIVDFLSGAAYARDGQILHIARGAYLLIPHDVDLLDFTTVRPPEAWTYDDAFGF